MGKYLFKTELMELVLVEANSMIEAREIVNNSNVSPKECEYAGCITYNLK